MVETKCPLCHAPLVNGECKKCGYISDDSPKNQTSNNKLSLISSTLTPEEKSQLLYESMEKEEKQNKKWTTYVILLTVGAFIFPAASFCFSNYLRHKHPTENINLLIIPSVISAFMLIARCVALAKGM